MVLLILLCVLILTIYTHIQVHVVLPYNIVTDHCATVIELFPV